MTSDAADSAVSGAQGEEGRFDSFDLLLRRVAQLCDSDIDRITVPVDGEVVGGKYRVEAQLAVGGMGAVLRATHVVSGKVVALKWLLPTAERAAARFLREVRAAARVDHPNVVDVYDLGTHRGGHYLVMELLHGRSLGSRLRAGRLKPAELVTTMIPVLRGLAAAHARGVIHRDLKPDNIFLCEGPDGSPREPKVLDFGISKLRESSEDAEALTGSGAGIGTPAYMSPEQLADARRVDERADIYAAGVIMYEALTGRLPFQVQHRALRALERGTARPLPLRVLEPTVPLALQQIVLKAMAAVASERHESADALASELSALTAHELSPLGLPRRSLAKRGGFVALATLAASLGLTAMGPDAAREKGDLPARNRAALATHSEERTVPDDVQRETKALESQGTAGKIERDASESDSIAKAPPPLAEPRSRRAWTGDVEMSKPPARPQTPRKRALRPSRQPSAVTPRAGKIYLEDL